jgi:hypothetical protein
MMSIIRLDCEYNHYKVEQYRPILDTCDKVPPASLFKLEIT